MHLVLQIPKQNLFYWFTRWKHKRGVFFLICFCFKFCHVCSHLRDWLIWLKYRQILQKRVFFFRLRPQRHSNASQSLCEIIRLSRDQMFQVQGCSEADPLLATLEKYVPHSPTLQDRPCLLLGSVCALHPHQAGDGGAAAVQHLWPGEERVCHRQCYSDPPHLVWDQETSVGFEAAATFFTVSSTEAHNL